MGRPYARELAALSETYTWAIHTEIDDFVTALEATFPFPLFITGSGGSLTAAHFAAFLHQRYARQIAKAATPLELVSASETARNGAVLVLSAGGRNADIIGAFRHAVHREPHRTVVVCGELDSPLSQEARARRSVDLIHLSPPAGKDGFLATNSLLAFSAGLCRAYWRAATIEACLPRTLVELTESSLEGGASSAALREESARLWEREYLVVLHGISTQAAASDIESKFTEAALGGVQTADYRNFAHGRHHWLAKRGSQSAVLALVTDDDRVVADRTLALIPKDVPVVRVDVPRAGAEAGLAMIVHALRVVGWAGEARGIDPGRPGVPAFGRRIYNLRTLTSNGSAKHLPSSEDIAIERKSGKDVGRSATDGEVDSWRNASRAFVRQLRRERFAGIVMDYDGTLCDGRDRFQGIGTDVADEVQRLLRANILIGVATGRGKSVKEDLRRAIDPSLWKRVIVGYYNGSDVALLDDDASPSQSETVRDALTSLADELTTNALMTQLAQITLRKSQITIEPTRRSDAEIVWDIASSIVFRQNVPGVAVVRSSHSVDVLAPGVSKRSVLDRVRQLVNGGADAALLCIGDSGRWPGNDFSLLAEPFSLSVDQVSSDPTTCWNLASPGYRGVDATLEYLRALIPASGRPGFFRWQG